MDMQIWKDLVLSSTIYDTSSVKCKPKGLASVKSKKYLWILAGNIISLKESEPQPCVRLLHVARFSISGVSFSKHLSRDYENPKSPHSYNKNARYLNRENIILPNAVLPTT